MRRALLVLAMAGCGSSEGSGPHHHGGGGSGYTLAITPGGPVVATAPVPLVFELRDEAGARVRKLDVVHEKLLHMIVVSNDLAFFTHEHPTQRGDGLLEHALVLPRAGDYTVYADFTPTGGHNAIARASLAVPGPAAPAVPLQVTALPAEAGDGTFTVALRSTRPLAAGGDAMLEFAIRDAKGPVHELADYLGAKGHCVVLSADRARYLHVHPMGASEGTVRFHTAFPAAGVYKLWVELRPRGQPLRVSFTIDVPPR